MPTSLNAHKANLDTTVSRSLHSAQMDALTIHEAAETTGWARACCATSSASGWSSPRARPPATASTARPSSSACAPCASCSTSTTSGCPTSRSRCGCAATAICARRPTPGSRPRPSARRRPGGRLAALGAGEAPAAARRAGAPHHDPHPGDRMTAITTPDYKVADIGLAAFGRKEIQLAEHEMPGLMSTRARVRRRAAAQGRAHHGLAAHDDPDRRADRDARRSRRRGPLGSCNIFSTQDHAAAAIAEAGIPVFAWKGETLEEYWWCTEQALTWPDGEGPNMILDDGGDATLLVHLGVEYEAAGAAPDPSTADSDEHRIILETLNRTLAEDAAEVDPRGGVDQGRDRGDHDRRAPPLPVRHPGQAAVPGDQRQRRGHQVQVRQPLRLPSLAGRRHQPRDRRHDRRQGLRRARLRRRRQGLRLGAARPGRPRHRHRDRPDLRAAGRDGGLPGRHARGRRRDRRHLHHDDGQQGRHLRRADGAHEAPGDRRQHRPLRQRDRHGRPGQDLRHRAHQDQAAGPRVALRRRPHDHRALRGPPAEPRQRHRPPVAS